MLISCSRTAVERDTSTSPACMVVNEPASFLADVGSSSVRFRSVSRAGSPFPLDMRLRLAGRAKWLYAVQHTLRSRIQYWWTLALALSSARQFVDCLPPYAVCSPPPCAEPHRRCIGDNGDDRR